MVLSFFLIVVPEKCPHHLFIKKHVCHHCRTLQSKLEFSRKRWRNYPTNAPNDVISGPAVQQVFRGTRTAISSVFPTIENYCRNLDVVTYHQCYKGPPEECIWRGSQCYIFHDVDNGHIYYELSHCMDTGYGQGEALHFSTTTTTTTTTPWQPDPNVYPPLSRKLTENDTMLEN